MVPPGLADDEIGRQWPQILESTLMKRIGELVNLEWDCVDFENRRIMVRPKDFRKAKGKEERTIPMHDGVFYRLLRLERRGRWAYISNKFRAQFGHNFLNRDLRSD